MSISKQTLHPEGDNSVDIYPKTSVDQVEGLEANPTEEGTENLEKIKIGDIVYKIPQGGGGGDTSEYIHQISMRWRDVSEVTYIYKVDVIIKSKYKFAVKGYVDLFECVSEDSQFIDGAGWFSNDNGVNWIPNEGGWTLSDVIIDTNHGNLVTFFGSSGPFSSGLGITPNDYILYCYDIVEEA